MPLKTIQPTIALACEADVELSLAVSNHAAKNTPANFALVPETLHDWEQTYRAHHKMYPWLIAREGARFLGFAKASPHRARGAYAWTAEVSVYIDEAAHGVGVGSALYNVLLPLLRAQGYATLLAGIVGGHVPSERLHAKFGFVRCGTFHRVGWKFDRWHDVGYWELALLADQDVPSPIRSVTEVMAIG